MEKLWAPWRMEYIKNKVKMEGCLFCNRWKKGVSKEMHVLYQSKCSFVILNIYPYNSGHVMVVPAEHAADLSGLSEEGYADLFRVVRKTTVAVTKALRPHGLNLGLNLGKAAGAGIVDHLHLHVLPRWEGDTNFMPLLAETKVLPHHLDFTYDQLLPYFKD